MSLLITTYMALLFQTQLISSLKVVTFNADGKLTADVTKQTEFVNYFRTTDAADLYILTEVTHTREAALAATAGLLSDAAHGINYVSSVPRSDQMYGGVSVGFIYNRNTVHVNEVKTAQNLRFRHVIADITYRGEHINVIGAHLKAELRRTPAAVRALTAVERTRQIQTILAYIWEKDGYGANANWIIAGDLNAPRTAAEIQLLLTGQPASPTAHRFATPMEILHVDGVDYIIASKAYMETKRKAGHTMGAPLPTISDYSDPHHKGIAVEIKPKTRTESAKQFPLDYSRYNNIILIIIGVICLCVACLCVSVVCWSFGYITAVTLHPKQLQNDDKYHPQIEISS